MGDSKSSGQSSSKIALSGTTLRVYRFLYRSKEPAGMYDIQRGLALSSPSVAQYHVKKLLRAGLIQEEEQGHSKESNVEQSMRGAARYYVNRTIFENMIRVRRSVIPLQLAYASFFATMLVILFVVLRPQYAISPSTYVFSLAVASAGLVLFLTEAITMLRSSI